MAAMLIENPNEYNITVNIAAPSLRVFMTGIMEYVEPLNRGRVSLVVVGHLQLEGWVITNGGQHEYNLGPSEILDLNWTISIEHGVAQMAPGFHSTDISAKVMEYGDDNTPCSEECPTILQSSIHELAHGGGWSGGVHSRVGSACDDYWYQWNMPDETYVFCDLDWLGWMRTCP